MEYRRFESDRTLMRIHVGESDKWHGKLLYQAIIEFLHQKGFYGATVLRGVGGYGSSTRFHIDKTLRLSQDLPILIEVVEYTACIDKILPRLDEVLHGGVITLEKAHLILYRPKQAVR